MREIGAADSGFAGELRTAVKAGKPCPPTRLVRRGRSKLLEDRVVRRLGLLGRGVLQRLAAEGDAVDIDRFPVTPERALVHHDRREHAGGAERGFLRSAHAFAGERVHGCRQLGPAEAEQTGQGAGAIVERGVERCGNCRLVAREAADLADARRQVQLHVGRRIGETRGEESRQVNRCNRVRTCRFVLRRPTEWCSCAPGCRRGSLLPRSRRASPSRWR